MYVLRDTMADRYVGDDGRWRDRDGARRYETRAAAVSAQRQSAWPVEVVELRADEPAYASW